MTYTGSYITPLFFLECSFNETVEIGSNQPEGYITFEKCIFNSSVRVHARNVSFKEQCVFNKDLIIQVDAYSNTSIAACYVNGLLDVTGSTNTLTIRNINFGQSIEDQKIRIGVVCSNLLIENITVNGIDFQSTSEVSGEFRIENVEAAKVRIGRLKLKAEMVFKKCKISDLDIEKVVGDNSNLSIYDSAIKEMKFQVSNLEKMSIVNSLFNSLELSNSNEKESIVNIEKTIISNLLFEKLFNNGLITLRELTIPSEGMVSFKSSNLGKADFIYCDFSKAILEFENSKITEAFISETEFPKRVFINREKNYGQEQLAFGQLATAFQKQGDSIRASEYSPRELEAHYHNIKWFSRDVFQKINLWLNGLSNNFGRSWIRGIIFSFLVGLTIFSLLLISTDKYDWGMPIIDFNMLPAYLKFMNPLRFFELEALFNGTPKQGNTRLNALSYLADFMGRILVAYGYYQTIQAFRRFGRK